MIEYIEIEGYKSIAHMKLELQPINLLIGGNGSGKSNFVSFFRLINNLFNQRLQRFVLEEGADSMLHFGRKKTEMLKSKLIFSNGSENNAYNFGLSQTSEGGLFIDYEGSGYNVTVEDDRHNYFYQQNLKESYWATDRHPRNTFLRDYITNIQVFHFHDTSSTSYLRRECEINDNRFFRQDGRNLPAYLYYLKEKFPKIYQRIEKVVQSVAPYIQRFILEPSQLNEREIELRWVDAGDPESSFSAYQLSDGTIRFIALATLLMQPEPPKVIVIDEPELGLHPFAINTLAGMMQSASSKAQIIAATQSPRLISQFAPEDVIVVDRSEAENQSIFERLQTEPLQAWLTEFDLGKLWENNIINAGQPFTK